MRFRRSWKSLLGCFLNGMNFICTFLSKGFPFDNNKIMNLTIFNIQIVLYVFFYYRRPFLGGEMRFIGSSWSLLGCFVGRMRF